MPVALSHGLGLMAQPAVDNLLPNIGRGGVGGERVPEDAETEDDLPLAASQSDLEVVSGLVAGQGLGGRTLDSFSDAGQPSRECRRSGLFTFVPGRLASLPAA